ncbi:cyclic nucleotide-binding domain-containing protein [Novispirillum itersonii]|uniref:CRP-like cAMP-binding protein n=1 Tax=Novispirillum itersonii TaxID=189 RepID=A0A7X0DN54_NOVIT|nr:cyclic nucleotide-binding domain-containing protein [Novispirillum itersonii]MBB6209882.1 CRP-like cAMP-binding protein [Novispirillum itersonii]
MTDSPLASLPLTVTEALSPAEREEIFRFRYDIYVREMGKFGMVEADHANGLLRDVEDAEARLYVARAVGKIAGTLRVLSGSKGVPARFAQMPDFQRFHGFGPDALSFSARLMVSPGLRGTPALNALVACAYGDGLNRGTQFDFCTCAPGLVDLYEHLGYRRFTTNVVDPVIGYQVPLVLVLRDTEHLEAIRSPLLRILRHHPDAGDGGPIGEWLRRTFPVKSVVRDWVEDEDLYWRFLTEKVWNSAAGQPSILTDLSEDEQKRLFRSGTVLECQRGDRIITTGTVGKEVFVVLSGLVEVRLPGEDTPLAVLDTGQVFGEIAFLADTTRSADVVAVSDARVLALSQNFLRRLMRTSPTMASKLLFNLSRTLCERLVTSNRHRTQETGF